MNYFLFCKGREGLWYTLILAVYLCSCSAIASTTPPLFLQQQKITGVITDAIGPLAGVTIAVKGAAVTAVSDENGRYNITASSSDILVFSYTGFKTVEKIVGQDTIFNVVLSEDATQLEEVVVNAGYYSVKQKESTGSISRITSKDIETQPVTNVLAVMQGRMAGVSVTQDSGAPGGGFQIRIRGQNSLRAEGNDPLYIVDGVPFSSETVGFNQTSGHYPSTTNPLNAINPSEIANIEVLKDADATAIYGSRGANGVVLITTKKGKAGKTSVSVSTSSAFGKVTRMMDMMDTQHYLAMRRQAYANDGITSYPDNAYDINGTWDQGRYTNWQKKLIGGTARINNLQASVSGGSAGTQYLLSADYRTETTVMPGNFEYKKGSVHFNMNHTSDDQNFKAVVTVGYNAQANDQPAADLTVISRTLAPNAPDLYDAQGNLNWAEGTWDNPLAVLEQKFTSRINTLTANSVLSYSILPSVTLKANLGFTDLKNTESRTQPSTMYNPSYGLTSSSSAIDINTTARQSWIIEPQVHWNLTRGKGKADALAGATFQSQYSDRLYQFGYGFASNSLINDLASASLLYVYTNDRVVYKYQAFFARVNYNWDGRYILNLTGRRDGSSRFGPGNQFANFGAVGAAWLFSNETFLKDNSVISFGKVRGSLGTSGNDQIGDYQFLDTYVSTGVPYQGINGLQPTRLYNPNFGWETNKKVELGLELGFLKDRIFLTSAWYRNRSSNQLVGIPLPGTTGFSTLTANLGATVQNSGLEFTLHTVNYQGKNFEWSTSFNIATNSNKLIAFPGLESSPYANTYKIGQSLNIRHLYHYTGINSETGVYQFQDVNNDGTVSSLEDKKTIADLTPDFFGGLQNQVTYKGFQLDFLFQFVKQQNFDYLPGVPGGAINQPLAAGGGWTQSGGAAGNQQFTTGQNGDAITAYYRYMESDGALRDASYIRLKNIALTYGLPLKMLNGVHCRLFAQGQNILTITPFKGGDPEMRFNSYLPPLRVFSAGVQVSF